MNLVAWSFDFLLAVTLLGVAWRVVAVADLFRAVVLFIAFGLLMALAWVRLAAPDVALAEAAIGAGLVGVLLLDALGFIRGEMSGQQRKTGVETDRSRHG
jgi:energy-converting hydrogenase B subunit D